VAAKVMKCVELGSVGVESVLNMLKLESGDASTNIIHSLEDENSENLLYYQYVYEKIIGIVKELGYEVPEDGSNLLFGSIVKNIDEFGLLIYEICLRLKCNIDITNMKYSAFKSIYDLTGYVGGLNEK